MRYSLIRVYLQLSRLQLMNHSINFPLHIFIVLLEESELIQYLLLINTNMFYPIWWYYLLVSSGVERTKYFSLFSFISTSVLVSLLLNGNITPVLIYWKNLLDMEKVSTATTSLYVVLQQSDMPFILLFIRIEKQFVCELFCEIVAFIIIFLTENTYKVV